MGKDKEQKAIKMKRIEYERRVQRAGGRGSNNSSDSETSRIRDEAAQQTSRAPFVPVQDGQAMQWHPQGPQGQRSQITYDPAYQYDRSQGRTPRADTDHEHLHQAVATSYQQYQGYSGPSSTNFHAQNPQQATTQNLDIRRNWERVEAEVNSPTSPFNNYPALQQGVTTQATYAIMAPDQHNETVAATLIAYLSDNNASGTVVDTMVRDIYNEAENRRRTGGTTVAQIYPRQPVAPAAAYTASETKTQGKQRRSGGS